jgi:predicted O-methyltransferase YrrM
VAHAALLVRARPISPELNYGAENFGLQDPELAAVRKQMMEQELEYMSLAPAEGRVLQFLIRGFGIHRIVEIGTLFGYSSLCMAKASPSGGEIISLEKDPGHCAVAVANAHASAAAEKIDVRCGDTWNCSRILMAVSTWCLSMPTRRVTSNTWIGRKRMFAGAA